MTVSLSITIQFNHFYLQSKGLEWQHSDIRSNYDHNASLDVNDNDDDPCKIYCSN